MLTWYLNPLSHVCSVAQEPKLDEWVARATLYDTLQDEVGFCLTFAIVLSVWKPLLRAACTVLLFQVRIAMVGKYTGLSDSYLSVLKVR